MLVTVTDCGNRWVLGFIIQKADTTKFWQESPLFLELEGTLDKCLALWSEAVRKSFLEVLQISLRAAVSLQAESPSWDFFEKRHLIIRPATLNRMRPKHIQWFTLFLESWMSFQWPNQPQLCIALDQQDLQNSHLCWCWSVWSLETNSNVQMSKWKIQPLEFPLVARLSYRGVGLDHSLWCARLIVSSVPITTMDQVFLSKFLTLEILSNVGMSDIQT